MTEVAKRKHIRALPDMEDFAFIDLKKEHTFEQFEPTLGAFIVNESPLGGGSLVLHKNDAIKEGIEILVKIGKMLPLHANIVWVKNLDEDLIRIGLKLLE